METPFSPAPSPGAFFGFFTEVRGTGTRKGTADSGEDVCVEQKSSRRAGAGHQALRLPDPGQGLVHANSFATNFGQGGNTDWDQKNRGIEAGIDYAVTDANSSRARLGLSLRKSFGDAASGWMWTPRATLSAVREFDGESSFLINDHFEGRTSIEGSSALLELGFTAKTGNLSIHGGLNWQDGGAMQSFFGGQVGLRYTFGGSTP